MQSLEQSLLSTGCRSIFAILDGAVIPELTARLNSFAPQHLCLFRGSLQLDLALVAPYLVFLSRRCPFTDWLLATGWGRHWGIYGGSDASFIELRKHFRHLFHVSDEKGRPYYFRFYDPVVFRNYLPRCTDQEAAEFFGPVQWIMVEDAVPGTARKFFLTQAATSDDRRSIAWTNQSIREVSWRSEPSR